MCRASSPSAPVQPSRRAILGGATAAGVGAALAGGASLVQAGGAYAAERAAFVTGAERPAAGEKQLTIAVMPDTQYLFDDASIHPDPVAASMRYLKQQKDHQNIVFLAHLGDLTQNGMPHEIASVRAQFASLDGALPWSALGGNHDVGGSTDSSRGWTPYLRGFRRTVGQDGVLAVSPDGYSTAHGFSAGGYDWLVLALDWRLSEAGFAWARRVLAANPHRPTILTTHEIVVTDGSPQGTLSDYGQQLWDELIADHDQIWLAVGGHYWPSATMVAQNKAKHDVHCHLANYQQRYYGGGAMLRLYHVDLERGTLDVETLAPWVDQRDPEGRNELMREELVVTGPADRFSVEIGYAERFAGFASLPVRPARSAAQMLVPGTVAYWRWDQAASFGGRPAVADLSGHGNHLQRLENGSAMHLVDDHHPDQPAHRSVRFTMGDCLQTVDSAPLNDATFAGGYTVETFFRLPQVWDGDNAWSALISRMGMAQEAGRTHDDQEEPVATLSLSGSRELQWCVYPASLRRSLTNWGHELRLDHWFHVAVVNDTQHTRMYVEGCEVARNPATVNRGLVTVGKPWLVGGYTYGGRLDKVTEATMGDVRICDRALAPREFMLR